jgi:hypothetical protein
MVVQEVPVDGLTETEIRRAAGGTSDDAFDNHTGRRTQYDPDGASQKADLSTCHGRSDASSRSYDGANGTTEASGQTTCVDAGRVALGAAQRDIHEAATPLVI